MHFDGGVSCDAIEYSLPISCSGAAGLTRIDTLEIQANIEQRDFRYPNTSNIDLHDTLSRASIGRGAFDRTPADVDIDASLQHCS